MTATKLTFTGGSSEIERRSKAAVATDGSSTIWTHGGTASGVEAGNFDKFDISTMTRTGLTATTYARNAHCMVYYLGALYVTLGWGNSTKSSSGGFQNDLWKYTISTQTWNYALIETDFSRTAPRPKEGAVCAVFGSVLYTWG
eukprot:tig00020693_g13025.t1